jgi:hypothetical protein
VVAALAATRPDRLSVADSLLWRIDADPTALRRIVTDLAQLTDVKGSPAGARRGHAHVRRVVRPWLPGPEGVPIVVTKEERCRESRRLRRRS